MQYPPAATLGRGETIAVIDTGFDAEQLGDQGPDVSGGANVLSTSGSTIDDNGHGTRMASIIGSRGALGVWGVAPGSQLVIVKALDAAGHGSPEDVATGIAYAVKAGANVISLSLATTTPSSALAAAVAGAEGAGVVVVAAAGDEGAEGADYPAAEPGVVAVYGQDRQGEIAGSSNLPHGPAVLGPGVDVSAIDNHVGASPTRVAVDETSAATAVVSGLIADCLSAQSGLGSGRTSWCEQALTVLSPGSFVNMGDVLSAVA